MIIRNVHDVIIAGAGPAGSVIAAQLARAGRRVAIIDASDFPRHKVCGEYLSPCIWRSLIELGISANVRAVAISLDKLEVVLPARRTTAIELQSLTCSADGATAPAALSRYAFDQLLLDYARESGATAYLKSRVRKVVVERQRAVGVEIVRDNDRAGTTLLEAPLIIAADGRKSTVVRDTGTLHRRGRDTRCGFKGHLRLPGSQAAAFERTLRLYSLPGGYVGVCPVEDGTLNVCGLLPAHLLRQARGAIDVALRNWCAADSSLAELLQAGRAELPWLAISDVSRQMAVPRCEGVLYVGDAQGTIEPVAGQGMTIAVEGALRLAHAVIAAGASSADAQLQASANRIWREQFNARRRWASLFGLALQHPRATSAVWTLATPVQGVRQQILRRAYAASMRGARQHGMPSAESTSI